MIKTGLIVRPPAPNMEIEFKDTQAVLATSAPAGYSPVRATENPNRVLKVREFILDGLGPVKELLSYPGDRFILSCVNEGSAEFKIGLYHLPRDVKEKLLTQEPDEVIGRFVADSIDAAEEYLEAVTARINAGNEDLRQVFALTGQELSVKFDEVRFSNRGA